MTYFTVIYIICLLSIAATWIFCNYYKYKATKLHLANLAKGLKLFEYKSTCPMISHITGVLWIEECEGKNYFKDEYDLRKWLNAMGATLKWSKECYPIKNF